MPAAGFNEFDSSSLSDSQAWRTWLSSAAEDEYGCAIKRRTVEGGGGVRDSMIDRFKSGSRIQAETTDLRNDPLRIAGVSGKCDDIDFRRVDTGDLQRR